MKKECCNCGHFNAYYSKGFTCYVRENFGYCNKEKKIIEKHDGCAYWRVKTYLRGRAKSAVLLKSVENAFCDLSVIRDFLEEQAKRE